MPRKLLLRSSDRCYHLTSRSNNKDWFYLPIKNCWEIFTNKLAIAAEKYKVNIHAFVLMSNHFHLLALSPNENIDAFMQYFISLSTKSIQRKTNRINHIFGGRYKWSLLYNSVTLAYAYKYIIRNPVRAKICRTVEEYPWSTYNNFSSPIPLMEGFDSYWNLIPKDPKTRQEWLNLDISKSAEDLIGKALRRYEFQFSRDANLIKKRQTLAECYGVETVCSATFSYEK